MARFGTQRYFAHFEVFVAEHFLNSRKPVCFFRMMLSAGTREAATGLRPFRIRNSCCALRCAHRCLVPTRRQLASDRCWVYILPNTVMSRLRDGMSRYAAPRMFL